MPVTNPNNMFEGKLVRLRAVEPADWETYYHWSSDTEMQRMEDQVDFPASRDQIRTWAENDSHDTGKDDVFHFQIETLNGDLVGRINTHHCVPRFGTFMFALVIAPSQRRKGYATEAVRLLIRYYFEERRYQKCTSEVFSFNEEGIKLHEKLGFTLEGRLRRMIYTRGQYFDSLLYGLTLEEFTAQKAKWSA
jgi:RimJ/RimL family protein N-acetyltransferase